MTHDAQTNVAFLNRLEGKPETDVEPVRTFRFVTLKVSDPDWAPRGARTRPPQMQNRILTFPVACRLAICLNLEKMQRQPGGVQWWSVVCGGHGSSGRKWNVVDIPVAKSGSPRWKPTSPLDLPPSVESITLPSERFSAWLLDRNATLFSHSRRWTVVVSPIMRTFRHMDSDAALWLQEIDSAIFQTDVAPQPVYNGHANGNGRGRDC